MHETSPETTTDASAPPTRVAWWRTSLIDGGIFLLVVVVLGGAALQGWLPDPLSLVAIVAPLIALSVPASLSIASFAKRRKDQGKAHLVAVAVLLLPALALQWMIVMGIAMSAMPRHD